MATPMSSMAEKIRKLLGTAEDQIGTPEGKTAARIARKLMEEHAISMADISMVEQQEVDPIEKRDTELSQQKQWMRDLMHEVGVHCDVKVVYYPGKSRMTIYGHRSNAEVCEYLYRIISRAIEKEAHAWNARNGIKRSDWRNYLREYTSYAASAVIGVAKKLLDIRMQAAAQRPTGAALVLRRKEQVDEWLEQQGLKFRKGQNHHEPEFNPAGYQMGKNVAIHDGISGETSKGPKLLG